MKLENMSEITVGEIGAYYGGLTIKCENGIPYWAIENWDGHCWQEITPELYLALLKFEGVKP